LLGPTDLFPQELGLVIKEFVQGDEVGNYVVEQVFLVAAVPGFSCGPTRLGF
jgi:hypothetical protein